MYVRRGRARGPAGGVAGRECAMLLEAGNKTAPWAGGTWRARGQTAGRITALVAQCAQVEGFVGEVRFLPLPFPR